MNFGEYNEIFNKNNYPCFKEMSSSPCQYFPDDNSPCICLSGKKFKDCCKKDVLDVFSMSDKERRAELTKLYSCTSHDEKRPDKTIHVTDKDKKLISNKVEFNSTHNKRIHYCACPGCKNQDVTDSNMCHTLSKSIVLKNLLTNNRDTKENLYSFFDHKMETDINFQNIADYYKNILIKDASIVNALCKEHDKELFAEIENNNRNFNPQTEKLQYLEYALKACLFQVFYVVTNIKYMAKLVETCKSVTYPSGDYDFFCDYHNDIEYLFEAFELQKKIIKDIINYKNNSSIDSKLNTILIQLPISKINFSLAEMKYIRVCLKNKTNEIHCFVNVINYGSPYLVISSYEPLKSMESKIKELFRDEKSFEKWETISFIFDELLYYSQNVFFNKHYIEKLSKFEQTLLYCIHRGYSIDDLINANFVEKSPKEVFQQIVRKMIVK